MRASRRIGRSDVSGALWSLVSTAGGLALAAALVPSVHLASGWSVVVAAAVVAVGDVIVRPVLHMIARHLGVVGALVAGLAAQVAVAGAALTFVPGLSADSWQSVVLVLIVAAVVMAIGRWAVNASDNEYVVDDLIRRGRRRAGGHLPGGRGVLIVQLDGVSRSTVDYALAAGLAPTLSRWLSSGGHTLDTWWARVPATTPASQAGLLHGTSEHVPAFRWWDRELGRMVVANRPADAALIELRSSNGEGLLAHGGVSVSNMFSGDGAVSAMVMSRAKSTLGSGWMFVHFFASPFVLSRALLGTFGEFCKELYQGWQQGLRGIRPRVSRLGAYPVLRAVTNVILRDLNTSVVAEHLMAGAPVIYVDLVDYDEIAHHAGPLRPESMRAIEGIDRVLGLWERVAQVAARTYDIVVLSDHGQSLGETFENQTGATFAAFVHSLMRLPEPDAGREHGVQADDTEAWGSVNAALSAFGRGEQGRVLVGPDRRAVDHEARAELPEVAVIGSGNLGMLWFPRFASTPDTDEIHVHWPALIPGLLQSPAIGVVVTRVGEDVIAWGAQGHCNVTTGAVDGDDPLVVYGPRARPDLRRVAALANAGDVIVLSRVDEVGMVHAFEGLVGSHGGLGGDQNEAILVYPSSWTVPEEEREQVGSARMLVGAERVHARLKAWIAQTGVHASGPAGAP